MGQSLEEITVSNDGYALPVENLLTGRGFITGKSGSGKSNTASVIIEELLDRDLGLLIVDTDGEYHGLKEDYDLLHVGQGPECDLDITAADADRLVPYALEDRMPILLDVTTYGEEATHEVLEAVVETLFEAEADYRIPFLLIVEEAHEFMPQQGGADSDLKNLLIRVAKRGRKRGLGICSMSQRPASVDKDYITQCDWFVWHRLTWDNDTAVVSRIMGSDRVETVKSLADGEALVLTDWDEQVDRVQFRRKRTADAGSTPSLDALDPSFGNEESRTRSDDTTSGSSGSTNSGKSATDSSDSSDRSPATAGNTPSASTKRSQRSMGSAGSDGQGRRSDGNGATGSAYASAKPSLRRRRERRETPAKNADPVWEFAAMLVYLYDVFAWLNLSVVYRMELVLSESVDALTDPSGDRNAPRRPGRYERYVYRFLAVTGLVGIYLIVFLVILRLF